MYIKNITPLEKGSFSHPKGNEESRGYGASDEDYNCRTPKSCGTLKSDGLKFDNVTH